MHTRSNTNRCQFLYRSLLMSGGEKVLLTFMIAVGLMVLFGLVLAGLGY